MSEPARVLFGTAGWHYKDRWGVVYPKPKPKGFDPLAFLARYFDTVELNNTFYRPVAPEVAKQWVERLVGYAIPRNR